MTYRIRRRKLPSTVRRAVQVDRTTSLCIYLTVRTDLPTGAFDALLRGVIEVNYRSLASSVSLRDDETVPVRVGGPGVYKARLIEQMMSDARDSMTK